MKTEEMKNYPYRLLEAQNRELLKMLSVIEIQRPLTFIVDKNCKIIGSIHEEDKKK